MALLLCAVLPHSVSAQEENTADKWFWGIGGGYRSTHMTFSDIDKSFFPTNKNQGSGIFSVFVQGEFGKDNRFGVRPQLSFLNRGGKLTEINKDAYETAWEGMGVEDVNYTLKAHYIDIRVPLSYNFGKNTSAVRPYVFVAPVLGFATGGEIKLQRDYVDHAYEGYAIDASRANLSSTYFAGQIGAGVKFAIPVARYRCYLGLEASYELGFTDTYGSKEKDGTAHDLAELFNSNYKINGTRKFSGFEVQAVLSLPFSIFKAKRNTDLPPAPVVAAPVEQPVETPAKEEKPCYTLDEIIALMAQNQNVEGKTICAVDAINFDFAKSTIRPESYEYLDRLASTLIRTNKRVEVKGHTDNVGSADFNMNLSRERAEAVVAYLVSQGVSRNKLTYSYYGMAKPLSSNDTEEGRAMNRRVEFTILNNF